MHHFHSNQNLVFSCSKPPQYRLQTPSQWRMQERTEHSLWLLGRLFYTQKKHLNVNNKWVKFINNKRMTFMNWVSSCSGTYAGFP
jgi:allophanate hydrolase subunit 1